jgi:hypothetical protein
MDTIKVQVAKMQLAYWYEATLEAARVHPNWRVTDDPERMPSDWMMTDEPLGVEWLGGRTGPRTANGLLNWFIRTHPEQCDHIRRRVAAVHLFRNTEPHQPPLTH